MRASSHRASTLNCSPSAWRLPDSRLGYTNVPAVAEPGIPDALEREPGVVMISALGFTADHFAAARRTSGERAWWALYMGQPSSPEGGLIKRDWLDTWRLPAAPQRPVYTVVGVDPSYSGSGDSCGIVAASLTGDGTVAVIADASAPMTSDQWARAAVELVVDVGALEVAVEAFAARETYLRVVKEALARYKLGRPIRATAWPPKGQRTRRRRRGSTQLGVAAGLGGRHRPARRVPTRTSSRPRSRVRQVRISPTH